MSFTRIHGPLIKELFYPKVQPMAKHLNTNKLIKNCQHVQILKRIVQNEWYKPMQFLPTIWGIWSTNNTLNSSTSSTWSTTTLLRCEQASYNLVIYVITCLNISYCKIYEVQFYGKSEWRYLPLSTTKILSPPAVITEQKFANNQSNDTYSSTSHFFLNLY